MYCTNVVAMAMSVAKQQTQASNSPRVSESVQIYNAEAGHSVNRSILSLSFRDGHSGTAEERTIV